MTLKAKLFNYFGENPILDGTPGKYNAVCKKFRIDVKTASKYWIDYKKESLGDSNTTKVGAQKITEYKGNTLSVNLNRIDYEVKSLEDLLAVCEVDTREWEVDRWECKKWDLGIKNVEQQIETKQLYSVSAKFKKRQLDTDLGLQKEAILKELFQNSVKTKGIIPAVFNTERNQLFEISIPDLHIGKLAHREESGEDYDIKIAVDRYRDSVSKLLSRVNTKTIGKILLPIGNDIIQVDNSKNTTTAGTHVDTDGRYFKIIRAVKQVLIETINDLTTIAPVDVVVVPGNHDSESSFLIGEILDAYYHNSNEVKVINGASLRKYYKFGNTSMLFTHGDKERHNNLGMIFAAENPKLWAETKYRFIKLGHLHHNKKVEYISTQEYQGFILQILPSLSSNDVWHTNKGFLSLKQAKAFLYDPNDGLIGEFTHTV